MSNYRRLISYIYAYEGGIKGKNIGFAKLEARNGQCKINVSVKKIYVGNNDMGVFLLAEGIEILLGKIFVRNGAGEYRTSVAVANVEGSGLTMDQCFGLTIHSLEDTWQSYTTIWEDAAARSIQAQSEEGGMEDLVTHAAEIQPAQSQLNPSIRQQSENDAVERSAEVELSEVTAQNREMEEMKLQPSDSVQEKPAQDMPFRHKSSIVEEIETEIQMQAAPKPWQPMEPQQELESVTDGQSEEPVRAPVGDTAALERMEREELEENQAEKLWYHFRKTYPKIQAFDYSGNCEILTIKPQDIGLLPRETWTFGNNSFLLHGYYNYRYLILAKLQNPEGRCRYLLGVPGHYYSNEKYMASMFGFPNFVLSKMQPAGDGRFGYWYADVSLGN